MPFEPHKEGKLKGLSYIVNGVKDVILGYDGKYGYGYGRQLKSGGNSKGYISKHCDTVKDERPLRCKNQESRLDLKWPKTSEFYKGKP